LPHEKRCRCGGRGVSEGREERKKGRTNALSTKYVLKAKDYEKGTSELSAGWDGSGDR